MTGYRSTPILPLFFLLPTLLLAQQENEIDWTYEIDLLGKELAQKHCNLFFQTDSTTFFRAFDQIARKAPELSLFDNSVRLQQVIAGLGDANTSINYHFNIEGKSILPLDFYWFEDGIYVMKGRKEQQEIVGKRLTAINGYPLEQIIDSMATLLVTDNVYSLKSQLPRMLTWTPLLKHFGFSGLKDFELQYETGQRGKAKLYVPLYDKVGEEVSIQPEKLPLGWQDRKSYFLDHYFPDERIYYIQYNKCWSREVEEDFGSGATALFMPSFKEFEKQVFLTIRKREIDKLVFDLRFNDGGNSSQGTNFIKKLSKLQLQGLGKIYVIVGRETSSAAVINTVDFMKNLEVVVVGEGTGGRPNHYGEVKRFVLPESRLVVNYSTRYFDLLEENVPSIMPDIETPLYFQQYLNGTDPALEAIRNHLSN